MKELESMVDSRGNVFLHINLFKRFSILIWYGIITLGWGEVMATLTALLKGVKCKLTHIGEHIF